VTLYVNATGLMWENAEEFSVLVVFAEHRYYGVSQLFPDDPLGRLEYLSTEQALMDYVTLISHLKKTYKFAATDSVIGFGGSYGGMLASWARMKYPQTWDGAIAASAPIVSFMDMTPPVNPNFYAEGVTYDVTPAAGASPACEANLRKTFAGKALAATSPSLIRKAFNLCPDAGTNANDASLGWNATFWLNTALFYMAMGNYPYRSSYILNGDGFLPAFPVRVACEFLDVDMTADDQEEMWLEGLASFAGVYYNYSGTLECNKFTSPVNKESLIVNTLWGYQYCSQIFQLFGQEPGPKDMFWYAPWNATQAAQACQQEHGFSPDISHFALSYGNPSDWARTTSNIVWSQGEYDPWRGGGVQTNLSDSLHAVVIAEAAHHLDLFFSHEGDTDAVIAARKFEMDQVRKWIQQKKTRKFRG
jgi:lysosomal Pro-X carboxypeptidase